MDLVRVTISGPPDTEPVTLDEVKKQVNVDHDDDDTYLTALIIAARQQVEVLLNRKLITTEVTQKMDYFCDVILLPFPRLQDVTSVKYIDQLGVEQTIDEADYQVDNVSEPGRLVAAYGKYWPLPRIQPNAVEIAFTCGYGDEPADVPECVKLAIKMLVAQYYANRETATEVEQFPVQMGIKNLIACERNLEA